MFKITNSNAKLGEIVAINLPAIKTCRIDAPCKKICYACKGNFNYPTVKQCYENNLQSFINDQTQTEIDIIKQLTKSNHCRVHASGDFFSREYLNMIISIAIKKPTIKFMAFTKQYELFNAYIEEGNKLPTNLKIIFSVWADFPMDNPHNFATAYTKLKSGLDNRIKTTAKACKNHCETCLICWNLKKGQQVYFNQH